MSPREVPAVVTRVWRPLGSAYRRFSVMLIAADGEQLGPVHFREAMGERVPEVGERLTVTIRGIE